MLLVPAELLELNFADCSCAHRDANGGPSTKSGDRLCSISRGSSQAARDFQNFQNENHVSQKKHCKSKTYTGLNRRNGREPIR
jgi:hypothetical protein